MVDWEAFGVEPGRTGGTGPWLEARHDIHSHSFNADQVARAELPSRGDELLSPRWRGLMVTSLNGFNRWLVYLALDPGTDGLGVEPFVLDFIPLNVSVAAPVVDAPHPEAARLLALFMLSEEG